jgi:RNA polymerase sigma-70 factor (ECF subfamily)
LLLANRGGRPRILRRTPVCYPVGVGIDRRPTRTRPVRTVSAEGARVSAGDQGPVTRASRGDVEAFRQLVEEHSSLIYSMAHRMLGGEHAQDASQEVWVRVWRYIKTFRGECAFSTWLHRITVNTCLTFRQRESRRHEREYGLSTEEMPYLPEPPGTEADPEAAALSAERKQEIQAALKHLRAEHRAALVLRHMEGLSYAEIAEVLEVPDGTAKGWVSRGRAAMLMALAEEEHSPGSMVEGTAP